MPHRANSGSFKKGQRPATYKGRIKRTGYWYLYLPDHPRAGKQGYVAEHRVVMEKIVGRYLERGEVVHHIDHDKTNNHPDNLKLYASPGQHTKLGHPELFERQKIEFKGKRFSTKSEFKKGHIPWNKPKSINDQFCAGGNSYKDTAH